MSDITTDLRKQIAEAIIGAGSWSGGTWLSALRQADRVVAKLQLTRRTSPADFMEDGSVLAVYNGVDRDAEGIAERWVTNWQRTK